MLPPGSRNWPLICPHCTDGSKKDLELLVLSLFSQRHLPLKQVSEITCPTIIDDKSRGIENIVEPSTYQRRDCLGAMLGSQYVCLCLSMCLFLSFSPPIFFFFFVFFFFFLSLSLFFLMFLSYKHNTLRRRLFGCEV